MIKPAADAMEPMLHASQPHVAPTLRNGSPATYAWDAWRSTAYPVAQGTMPRVAASGPGSLAGFGRRFLALLIDWLIAYGLAGLAWAFGWLRRRRCRPRCWSSGSCLGVVSVRLFGFTPGQFALGLQVVSVDDRLHVGIGRAAVRGLLIALVVPPLFADSDGRGLQDRLTATAVVRR